MGPDGFTKGYFVKPTVFADVRNDMTIAREEIFGPVLCMIPYEDENEDMAGIGLDDVVAIGLDSPRAGQRLRLAQRARFHQLCASQVGGF